MKSSEVKVKGEDEDHVEISQVQNKNKRYGERQVAETGGVDSSLTRRKRQQKQSRTTSDASDTLNVGNTRQQDSIITFTHVSTASKYLRYPHNCATDTHRLVGRLGLLTCDTVVDPSSRYLGTVDTTRVSCLPSANPDDCRVLSCAGSFHWPVLCLRRYISPQTLQSLSRD